MAINAGPMTVDAVMALAERFACSLRSAPQILRAEDFGAAADGVTDDTGALQRMADTCAALNTEADKSRAALRAAVELLAQQARAKALEDAGDAIAHEASLWRGEQDVTDFRLSEARIRAMKSATLCAP